MPPSILPFTGYRLQPPYLLLPSHSPKLKTPGLSLSLSPLPCALLLPQQPQPQLPSLLACHPNIPLPYFPPHCLRRLLRLAVDCHDLLLGQTIHAAVFKGYFNEETLLLNAIISMYIKLGCLSDARKVFEGFSFPDVVSFTSLISAYAKCGCQLLAVDLFDQMRFLGLEPNEFSFVAILTSCIRQLDFELGSQVHAFATKTGHCSCVHVANALLGMYIKGGRPDAAEQLFGKMAQRDVSSWNAVIFGMVKDGRYGDAFELFTRMQLDGDCGDQFSLSTLLTAADNGFLPAHGEAVHAHALKIGLESDLSVGNALITFYTRFGCVDDVASVFQRMPVKDVISWTAMLTGFMEFGLVEPAVDIFDQMPKRNCATYNALLAGFCQHGEGFRGLQLFQQILQNGLEISDLTVTSVLNAGAIASDLRTSEQIHAFVIKVGVELSAVIEAALIDMCAKCGRTEDAHKILRRWTHNEGFQVAWTSVMCAYARNGQPNEAFSLFQTILRRDGTEGMDEFTFATVLGVCGALGFSEIGRQIHCLVVKSGLLSDLAIENAIFTMYAKCGSLEDAISFFSQMPQHDIVSWNALITAHLLYHQGDKALDIWRNMERLHMKPDSITFVLIISACRYTSSNSVDYCQRLFLSMTNSYHLEPASEHYAAMVNVLGHWGSFDEAEQLINHIPFKPDALVWRSLLDSCRLRSNLKLGRRAMQHLLALEPQDASTYILVSNLYSASGRWHCSEKVRQEMREKGLQKHPAQSWTINESTVHSFYARDRSNPQFKDIYSGLDILILECMKAGYEPDTSFVLHEVEEYQKRHFLFYHSAKLAVMYGLLMADHSRPVRVVKNIHLCGDCHTFLKYVSFVTGRQITVRDTSGFHNFWGGECSCRDY